jgi:hypothetical protein
MTIGSLHTTNFIFLFMQQLFLFGKVVNRLSEFLRKGAENSDFEHSRKISYYNNDDICLRFYLYFKFMAPRPPRSYVCSLRNLLRK